MSTATAPEPGPVLETPPAWRRAARRARAAFSAFEDIWRNRDLRNLQLAFVGSVTGSWAFGIALAVYAYRVDGAAGVGLAGLLRTIPSALAGPFAAALGDRHSRVRVMVLSDLIRAFFFAACALAVLVDGPSLVVYILAGLIMLAGTAFRPAQAAVLPQLTKSPEELTASNVVSTTVESVGFFAGPALGGLLLAATSVETVFLVTGSTCLISAAFLIGIKVDSQRVEEPEEEREGFFRHAMGGFRAAREDANVFLLLTLFAIQTLIAGALTVLTVVLALEILGGGEAEVGYLTAATGVGGVLGAAVAAAAVKGRHLTGGFVAGNLLWGLPLVVIGLFPESIVGYLMLAGIGLGNTLVDVAGFTLLQRAVPDEVMARVFGVLETLLMATVGLGALLTPILLDAVGREEGFILIGLLLPVATLATAHRLHALDDHADPPREALELLQAHAIFKPLALITQEQLAVKLEERVVGPDALVIEQGDENPKDFFLIADGDFVAFVDGEEIRHMGTGDGFGEIALLRDLPRTATVKAGPGGGRLYALGRGDFLRAVQGTRTGASAAESLASSRLYARR